MDDGLDARSKLYDEALLRMKRAHDRGTGCYLTPEMIDAMSVMVIGEWWGSVDEVSGGSKL